MTQIIIATMVNRNIIRTQVIMMTMDIMMIPVITTPVITMIMTPAITMVIKNETLD
jgi:hypothetical protein